jgi:arabinofuranosyltransferase
MTRVKRISLIILLITIALWPYINQAVYYWHYTNDDAYITFRYSRNLAEGQGPYFNSGEHVEGYTSFLQMLNTAVIIRTFGPDNSPTIVRLLGILFGGGCVVLTFLLFRKIFCSAKKPLPEPWILAGALAAAASVGISPSFALNSTSGLETTMFAFWLLLGLFLGLREGTSTRRHCAAVVFALALLTRPESSVLFATYWTACAATVIWKWYSAKSNPAQSSLRDLTQLRDIRILLVDGVIVASVFLAYMAFRYAVYDGEVFPNTYFAKKGGFWGQSTWTYMHNGLLAPLFGFVGVAVSTVGLVVARRRIPTQLLYIAVMAMTGCMVVYITGIDWMVGYRFVIPYLPFVSILFVSGWILLFSFWKRLGPPCIILVLLLLVPSLWFIQNKTRESLYDKTFVRHYGYKTGHRAMAQWIAGRANSGDTIALVDIGIVGYNCIQQNILDLSGLTDRHIAKSKGAFLKKVYDPQYILNRKPEFIVITLCAPGRSYSLPPEGTKFRHGFAMETKLVTHPQFKKYYMKKRTPNNTSSTNWLDNFAASLGAEKAFEHGTHGRFYILIVYCRNAERFSAGDVQKYNNRVGPKRTRGL